MKRVLYIATRTPLPVIGGRERMISQSLKMLRHQYQVGFVYFARKGTHVDNLNNELHQAFDLEYIQSLRFPTKGELVLNLFRAGSCSLQELLFYSKNSQDAISRAIAEFKPDLIVADMIRVAQFVEDISLPKILELDDLLSERYRKFCNMTSSEDNLLGTFGELLPKLLNNFLHQTCKMSLLKFEAKQIERRELELSCKFDAVTLVSHKEVDRLKQATGLTHIYAMPPTVERLTTIHNNDIAGKCNILFLGNATTNQNLSSIRFIANEILPLLDAKLFDYSFTIVGNYDHRASEIADKNHKIILAGFVDSLSEAISTKHLMLSPITFGSGIKTKILDAMSFGIPTITNSIGAEGLNVDNGVHLIIEEDPKLLADSVELLFHDKEWRDRIATAGKELVNSDYCDTLIAERYTNIIEKVLSCNQNFTSVTDTVSFDRDLTVKEQQMEQLQLVD